MARAAAKSRKQKGAGREASRTKERDEPMLVAAGSEILGLVLIGLALLSTLALATYAPEDPVAKLVEVSNSAGPVGATLAGLLLSSFGAGSIVLVAACAFLGGRLVMSLGFPSLFSRFWIGAALLIPSMAILPPLLFELAPDSVPWIESGWLGGGGSGYATRLFGSAGAIVLTSLVFMVGVLSLTGISMGTTLGILGRTGARIASWALWAGDWIFNQVKIVAEALVRTIQAVVCTRWSSGRRGWGMAEVYPRSARAAGAAGEGARAPRARVLVRRGSGAERRRSARTGRSSRGAVCGPRATQASSGRGARHRRPRRRAQEKEEAGAGGFPVSRTRTKRAVPAARRFSLRGAARRRALLRPRLAADELEDPREEARGFRSDGSGGSGSSRSCHHDVRVRAGGGDQGQQDRQPYGRSHYGPSRHLDPDHRAAARKVGRRDRGAESAAGDSVSARDARIRELPQEQGRALGGDGQGYLRKLGDLGSCEDAASAGRRFDWYGQERLPELIPVLAVMPSYAE